MAHPLAGHAALRNTMQLAMDDGDQTFQRLIVAVTPRCEQPRDIE
jgi:hypothetical protein